MKEFDKDPDLKADIWDKENSPNKPRRRSAGKETAARRLGFMKKRTSGFLSLTPGGLES